MGRIDISTRVGTKKFTSDEHGLYDELSEIAVKTSPRNTFVTHTFSELQKLAIKRRWTYEKTSESAKGDSLYVTLNCSVSEKTWTLKLRISNHPRPEWRVLSEPMHIVDVVAGDSMERIEATIERNVGYLIAAGRKE